MNSSNIMELMTNIIGPYQATTPPSVSVDVTGIDPTTPVSFISNIGYGISTLDIKWIVSAIFLIVAFVCVMSLIRSVLTAIVR
ncbi:hypothetical protein [Clostridium beijerinckii]|uniref:hypothetical protein n=1 Tax=Clostridium beijerinckii TaxID=1520 RepID=UPI0003D31E39|nr:hypothetical protein [Clostridium beijerinckii]ALB48314.1 hypothetical protein X276_25150 [Clostridium beijerinckii NRRL B-598]